MPKSKIRPRAAEKKKHANKLKLMLKKAAKQGLLSKGPANKQKSTYTLAGNVKVNNTSNRPTYHNKKGGGE